MSHDNVRAIIGEPREITTRDAWPAPDMRLVNDDHAPAPALEDDALPAGWEAWITAEAAARACPRDYVAAGLIGAASAWIGNARRIAATADWIEPAHLWFALIGAPSTGKTPALRPMIDASRKLERDAELAWHDAVVKYERDVEAASAADKLWREDVGRAAKGKVSPPDRPVAAEAPYKPPRPRVITMDTSTEELQQLLAENPRGLLHMRDELSGWLGSFDRYGGDGADRGFYLECWNGGPYVCDRVKFNDVPLRIEHALLSVIGGMVPDRLRETLADADDGLPARFIYVWPEPTPIVPLCERGSADAAERCNMLHSSARRLRTLAMGVDNDGQAAPRALQLERSAFGLFDEQQQEARRHARAASGLFAGWHGKNPGRLLRLTLVFEYLAWAALGDGAPEAASVSADAVVRAGGFVDYAGAMLERVIGGLAVTRAVADAAQVARYVQAIARTAPLNARLKPLNERSLYQMRGFAWARDRKRRSEAFAVLQDANLLKPAQVHSSGRPPSDWLVNPKIAREVP
jgi:hypothetical protein